MRLDKKKHVVFSPVANFSRFKQWTVQTAEEYARQLFLHFYVYWLENNIKKTIQYLLYLLRLFASYSDIYRYTYIFNSQPVRLGCLYTLFNTTSPAATLLEDARIDFTVTTRQQLYRQLYWYTYAALPRIPWIWPPLLFNTFQHSYTYKNVFRFQFGKSSLPGKLGVMVQSLCWSQDSSMLVATQVESTV